MRLNKKFFFGIITLFIFFIGIISPTFVFAVEPVAPTPVYFCGQVDIPILNTIFKKSEPKADKSDCTKIDTSSIAKLASDMYRFIAGIAGIAAVIVMMAGGYVWLFAGGNASKVTEAKSLIGSAVLGLVLVLGSYMILNLINPKLIQLPKIDTGTINSISIKGVDRICTAQEDAEIEKKAGDGCGKVYTYQDKSDASKSISCMRVSCEIPGLIAGFITGDHPTCVLLADEKGDFYGGSCETTIRVFNSGKQDFIVDDVYYTSPYYEQSGGFMTILKVKAKTLDRLTDKQCGLVEDNETTVVNDCVKEGGSDKNTCVFVRQDGQNDPAIDFMGGNNKWVSFSYKKKEKYMKCRNELVNELK